MKTTINTRRHGELTFFCPAYGEYVWVDMNGKPGTLGMQICDNGHLSGSTLSWYYDDFESFCRKWWRAYLRNERAEA